MLARIVENWLTEAGERGYEVAFAQLLHCEGHTVLQGPVHHPFEHGKDIITISPAGELCAFQLKGDDLTQDDFGSLNAQLWALATAAVNYPRVEPPRRADRVFLVTSGTCTPPARDRLRSINDSLRGMGVPPIELVEKEQLVRRFVDANGEFVPSEVGALRSLFELLAAQGESPLPRRPFAELLRSVLGNLRPGEHLRAKRAINSCGLLASYASTPWRKANNFVAVAEAWLLYCFEVLQLAEEHDLAEQAWIGSFEIGRASALENLHALLNEALACEDLVVPSLIEGFVYPVRVGLVCGYACALLLAEEFLGRDESIRDRVIRLVSREFEYFRAVGESSAAALYVVAAALWSLDDHLRAARLCFRWSQELVRRNQPDLDAEEGIADPYHDAEELLLDLLNEPGERKERENFAGRTYTLRPFLEWLVRRDVRDAVDRFWPDITRIQLCGLLPSKPSRLLAGDDDQGVLECVALPTPSSWSRLRAEAIHLEEESLPRRLWQQLWLLPFLVLVWPHRLNRITAQGIDYLAGGPVEVILGEEVDT